MKEHMLQSLVPLLLLVHDERPNMSQLTRYKGRANNFLCQTMAFLENPQAPIREAAIRFIGNHRAEGSLWQGGRIRSQALLSPCQQ
ncbi:Rhombotin-1 [Platysternon megacephalum]|uniref:Rhombotin-1 n=1 Tax=Platysternon megacephalum TaxID=55544 RepID=A0A4D9DG25_9SAUR|nr:Rhombotin-1 [Platysternon megacephalum]